MTESERHNPTPRDVTEQFLSMSSSDFMDFLHGSQSNSIRTRFDQLDDAKRTRLEILLNRRLITKIEIEATADNLEEGDIITVTASLHYIDTNNTRYIIAAEDTSEITAEDLTGGGLTATILDAFRGFFTNPIFWVLIALLLLYLIYRFLTARREPPMYPPAGGGPTVVAYPPTGGPGTQMYSAPQAPPRPPEGPPFG